MKNLTEQVSPIELQKGDRVEAYGALMEVMHIVESGCDVPGGVRVAACVSRVIGDTTGTIPRGWLETPEQMSERGQPGPQSFRLGCTGTFRAMPMPESAG